MGKPTVNNTWNDYTETTVTVHTGKVWLAVVGLGIAIAVAAVPFVAVLAQALAVVLYVVAGSVAVLSVAASASLVLHVWGEVEAKRLASQPPILHISAPTTNIDNRAIIVVRDDGARFALPQQPSETRNDYLRRLALFQAHGYQIEAKEVQCRP